MADPKNLFNRAWTVQLQRDDQNTAIRYNNLRVTFDIDKKNSGTANKGKIDVWNLDLNSRQQFVKGVIITLVAGYEGFTDLIFKGNVSKVVTERKGPDIVTSFECGEGEQEIAYGLFNQSYPPKTSYAQVFRDILSELQLAGISTGIVLGIPVLTYSTGVTFSGTVKDALDNLTENIGATWSIQSGKFQMIPNKGFNGEQAIFVSEETGMIGVASQGTEFTQFTSLLNPKIVPGCAVQISSQAILGQFKVNRAKYEGDSHGQKWQVYCECARTNTTQAYIPNRGLNLYTGLA